MNDLVHLSLSVSNLFVPKDGKFTTNRFEVVRSAAVSHLVQQHLQEVSTLLKSHQDWL